MHSTEFKIYFFLTSLCLVQTSPKVFDSVAVPPTTFFCDRYKRSRGKTALIDGSPRDIGLNFVELVRSYGYPGEEHCAITKDGYVLRFHRIPRSPIYPGDSQRPVVFLQHGIFGSSDMWVLVGPNRDLAYMLADDGYDVWIGNIRGNTYSRSHVKLSPDYDPQFWKFSFHEMAMYDVPTMIDYILLTTNQTSLVYVGHSMGTTISYAMLSTKPEYNSKISMVVSLAPVAFWHGKNTLFVKFLKDNLSFIKRVVTRARIYEMFPLSATNARLAKSACSDGSVLEKLCMGMLYFVSGYNPYQINSTVFSHLLSFFPAGGSTQTLLHYSQNLIDGDFKMYDYGPKYNYARYKQLIPPRYNLKKITVPVALFYGLGDGVISPEDPVELSLKLPNVLTFEAISDERFSHFDFLFSKDINTLLNSRVMHVMSRSFGKYPRYSS